MPGSLLTIHPASSSDRAEGGEFAPVGPVENAISLWSSSGSSPRTPGSSKHA